MLTFKKWWPMYKLYKILFKLFQQRLLIKIFTKEIINNNKANNL